MKCSFYLPRCVYRLTFPVSATASAKPFPTTANVPGDPVECRKESVSLLQQILQGNELPKRLFRMMSEVLTRRASSNTNMIKKKLLHQFLKKFALLLSLS